MLRNAVLFAGALAAFVAPESQARDSIYIVGSSTVYPFSTVVAEQFGKTSTFKTPKVESTGTGGGFKLFCAGTGASHPDISNASRKIKDTEVESCAKNGVKDIVELKIGYDGIVFASSKSSKPVDFTLHDVWLALAKEVPDPKGGEKLVANPYRTWKNVNPELPDVKIEVLGPPPTSGTRDAFAELALEGGCKTFDWIKKKKDANEGEYTKICHTIREDGAYVEAGENDNLIVQKLQANKNAFGVFGYSFLEQNGDKVQGNSVDGVKPEFDAIASGKYAVSRPLFIYVKKAHVGVIPGLKEYVAEYTSEKAWGEDGYLADKGLIPMPEDERKKYFEVAKELKPLSVAAR